MATIDTTVPSLTIVKSFSYRGAAEEWSNSYFFTGATPSGPTDWHSLAMAVSVQEKTLYDSTQEIIKWIGHEPGESVAVWSEDLVALSETIPGTLAVGGAVVPQGGDSAAWIRYTTDGISSKGKPIYLRNYYHPAYAEGSTAALADSVSSTWQTAAEAFGTTWLDGAYVVNGTERYRCGPKGGVAQSRQVSAFVTTRTLERRGRRP